MGNGVKIFKYCLPALLILPFLAYVAFTHLDSSVDRSYTKTNTASVSGTVVDSRSGMPLKDTTVIIDDVSISTDSNGKFTLDGVGLGKHVIRALNLGYENHIRSISVSEGKTLSLDISMNAAPEITIR